MKYHHFPIIIIIIATTLASNALAIQQISTVKNMRLWELSKSTQPNDQSDNV
jgi:hypothetical protein